MKIKSLFDELSPAKPLEKETFPANRKKIIKNVEKLLVKQDGEK